MVLNKTRLTADFRFIVVLQNSDGINGGSWTQPTAIAAILAASEL